MPSGTLQIHDVSFEDAGMYQCLISTLPEQPDGTGSPRRLQSRSAVLEVLPGDCLSLIVLVLVCGSFTAITVVVGVFVRLLIFIGSLI